MDFLLNIWTFFQSNILTQPAYFVGLMVLVGSLLLKKPVYEAYAAFVKATVGYQIASVGSGGLVSTFRPILVGLNDKFNMNAAVIDPYFGEAAAKSALEAVGRTTSLIVVAMIVAFFLNILLVVLRKVTKIRTLFTTGHVMLQQCATGLWILIFCFPQLQDMTAVILLGILVGVFWSVSSNLTVEIVQDLTDGGGFALGHQQMFGLWFVSKLAPKVGGKNDKKLDDIVFPGWLSIFNENVVATATLMTIFIGAIMLLLGPELSGAGSSNFFFYILTTCYKFAVNLTILQLGVRMFVAELSEAFTGISERILPGSVPAVDCAAMFGFGHPNAPLLGFVFGCLGQFLAIAGLLIFKSPVMIITGFVPVFFDNATFAIVANHKSGVKAACVLPFISGLLQVLGGACCAAMFQTYQYGGYHGNFDIDTIWLMGGAAIKYLGWIGYGLCIVVLLAIPQLQYRRDPKNYFTCTEDYEAYKAAHGK